MTDSRYVQEGCERILALYFNTRGFAYALMNSPLEVIDKGQKINLGTDNKKIMIALKRIIRKTEPERIIIEDHTGEGSRKSKRIRDLLDSVSKHVQQKGIALSKYSRDNIRTVFSVWHAQTRYEIAEVIAKNVEAYQNLLFEKPKYPKTEHSLSGQFDAASIGITHYFITT